MSTPESSNQTPADGAEQPGNAVFYHASYDDGYDEGYREGYDDGYRAGREDGNDGKGV